MGRAIFDYCCAEVPLKMYRHGSFQGTTEFVFYGPI